MKQGVLDFFDSLAIISICIILAMAFYYQLFFQELPCCIVCISKNGFKLTNFWLVTKLNSW